MSQSIKNSELGKAIEALHALAKERLPVTGALRVRKLERALMEHAQDVEEVRKKLLDQYGQKDADGKLIVNGDIIPLIPETLMEFHAEFAALMAEGFSTEYPVRVADLGNITVAPQVLIDLGDLLEEGE